MDIQIHWHLSQTTDIPEITIKFYKKFTNDYLYNEKIKSDNGISFCVDLDFKEEYILEISRNNLIKNRHHSNWIIIDKVVLDKFWTIDENNNSSFSVLNADYMEIAKQNGADWELQKHNTYHNNVLFFNGKIIYNIITPIRKNFWK